MTGQTINAVTKFIKYDFFYVLSTRLKYYTFKLLQRTVPNERNCVTPRTLSLSSFVFFRLQLTDSLGECGSLRRDEFLVPL